MKISIHTIVKELTDLSPEPVCHFDIAFSSFAVLESTPTENETLNICDVTKFVTMNNMTDKKTYIVIDPLNILEEVKISPKINLIAIKDNIPMSTLINRIIKIFEEYNRFEQALLASIHQGVTLENILLYAYKNLGLEMYLYDARGNVLFRNSNTYKYYPQSVIQSKTIRDGNKSLGSLALMQSKTLSEKYQIAMFTFFCEQLDNLLYEYFDDKRDAYQDLNRMIMDSLNSGIPIDRELISKKLRILDWTLEDSYRLLLIVSPKYESIQRIIDYLNEQYKRDSLLLKHDGKYVFIVNSNKVNTDILLSELRLMLDVKSDLKILSSIPFSDLSEVTRVYRLFAALIGAIGYELIDLNTDAIKVLLLLSKDLDKRIFIHSEVLKLQKLDEEQGGDLLETLYAYICYERSLLKTAKKLNVHRNTVVYRTSKISELVDLDLENPLTRYHILLSILLIVGDRLLKYN
ncbi:MAG: helix-turn-helix domain-containing protein [Tissierellia bacterium]|nr:helix-turn-helix domain-containing protein [Tissierellia bacterium]